MKKHLIVAAVAAAVAGPDVAQVSVFGILDLGHSSQEKKATSTSNAGATTDTKAVGASEGLSGSRLGFRGNEDLGGGLKAGFVYELGINVGASTADHSVRGAHLTISSSNLGSLNIGRNNSLGKNMNDQHTAFGGGGDFEQGAVTLELVRGEELANATAVLLKSAVADRLSNQITYTAPTFSGLTLSAQMSDSSSDTTATNGTAVSSGADNLAFRIDYKAGPLTVAAASTTSKSQTEASSPVKTDAKLSQYGATYTLGGLKFFGLYNDATYQASEGAVKQEHKGYDVGATYTVGATTFLASVGKGDMKDASSNVTDLEGYQAQVRYALSKRTTAYALYGETEATGYVQGVSDVMMIGVRHSF
jgi:predicted porin